MNITLCSAFRNSKDTLDRYFAQVKKLQQALAKRGDALHLILGEGDSRDGTLIELEKLSTSFDVKLVDCTHGGPEFGSVVDSLRFLQCAYVGNLIWRHIPANADVVAFIDSDIVWDAKTVISLIDKTEDYPAISPMIFLSRSGWPEYSFYNVFDFRIGGVRFTHEPPYHADLDVKKITQVDSAGSCLVMRADLARQLYFPAQDSIVGLCSVINKLGATVWVDPALKVFHE